MTEEHIDPRKEHKMQAAHVNLILNIHADRLEISKQLTIKAIDIFPHAAPQPLNALVVGQQCIPSICHNENGAATQYVRRVIAACQRDAAASGSAARSATATRIA